MIECPNCQDEVTKKESVKLQKADEETKEVLDTVGRFCSITCGEEYTAGGCA